MPFLFLNCPLIDIAFGQYVKFPYHCPSHSIDRANLLKPFKINQLQQNAGNNHDWNDGSNFENAPKISTAKYYAPKLVIVASKASTAVSPIATYPLSY